MVVECIGNGVQLCVIITYLIGSKILCVYLNKYVIKNNVSMEFYFKKKRF